MEKEHEDLLEQLDGMEETATVPVSVVKAIRAELKETKSGLAQKDDQLLIYRTQLQTLTANGGGQPQNQNNQTPAQDPLFEGLDDDEPLTAGQAKRIMAAVNRQNAEVTTIAQVTSQPEFNEVTQIHLPNVLRANPALVQTLRSIPTEAGRWALAYQLGKTDPAYLAKKVTSKDGKPEAHPDAKKIEENLSKPGSPSGVQPGSVVGEGLADKVDKLVPGTPEFRAFRANARRGKV